MAFLAPMRAPRAPKRNANGMPTNWIMSTVPMMMPGESLRSVA